MALQIEVPALLPHLGKAGFGFLCVAFQQGEHGIDIAVRLLVGIALEACEGFLVGLLVVFGRHHVHAAAGIERHGEESGVVGQRHVEHRLLAHADEPHGVVHLVHGELLRRDALTFGHEPVVFFGKVVQQFLSQHGKQDVGFFFLGVGKEALCVLPLGGREIALDFLRSG
ncbi:MAG: hypothetical protein IJA95_07035 [Bacteroidaceae bacterium]|nr:hypothetical protein [Bacteroidaceae bacterium]